MKRLIVLAVLAVALASCGTQGVPRPNSSTTSPVPTLTAQPTMTPNVSLMSAMPVEPTDPADPAPTIPKGKRSGSAPSASVLTDAQQEYMLRLEAIRPDLSSDENVALANAARVCARAAAGDTYSELLAVTSRMYSTPKRPVTAEETAQIYEVVRGSLCP